MFTLLFFCLQIVSGDRPLRSIKSGFLGGSFLSLPLQKTRKTVSYVNLSDVTNSDFDIDRSCVQAIVYFSFYVRESKERCSREMLVFILEPFAVIVENKVK